MKLNQAGAELFIPDGSDESIALGRTTHLAIGAHHDDLEIMAFHGILECFKDAERWFTGVVVTNGSGSARSGAYADYTDEQMIDVRKQEQKKAAEIGRYSAQFLLQYPSSSVKSAAKADASNEILEVLIATRPRIVYTHNFADKHDTHVGVARNVIDAIRRMPAGERPEYVYGCEVWRNLDWMLDSDKVALDISGNEKLHEQLLVVFDSQISGGKHYDLATLGRSRANATYHESHGVDATTGLTFAMDLRPLIADPALDISEYTLGFVTRLRDDVASRIKRVSD